MRRRASAGDSFAMAMQASEEAAFFLSPRTVDTHVCSLLRKLDCRSRVKAAHRAGELELLA